MALNDYRGNSYGGTQRKTSSTYYSRFHCLNIEEHTRLNISYFSGMMKLTIAQSTDNSNQYEDKISVCLTGNKATLFLDAIAKFESEFNTAQIKQAYGVTTGMSDVATVLAIHKNDKDGKAITIAKVDQNGTITDRYEFNFPTGYDSYLNFSDFNSMKTEKEFDDDLQYNMLKKTLVDFTNTIGGGSGYNTIDIARYDINRQQNNIETIMDKLGVPRRTTNNNYSRSSSGNYFNRNSDSQYSNSGRQAESKSLDEIEDYIGDEDE